MFSSVISKFSIEVNSKRGSSNFLNGESYLGFSTYSIYILREGDTLEKVMEKYNITKEKLQEYNDLGTITLNSKIIIPNSINE